MKHCSGMVILVWSMTVLLQLRPVRLEYAKHLELIEHALHNDVEWHEVLHQKIVLDQRNRPSYQTEKVAAETRDKLRIFDDGLSEVSPLSVIRKVIRDFAWLGSHVAYAAYVLRTALACFTYSYLLEMLAIVDRMIRERPKSKNKNDEDKETLLEIDRSTIADAWSIVAVLTDKLAAVDGDLDAITDLSYTLAAALRSYGTAQFRIVGLLQTEFETLVKGRCVTLQSKPRLNAGSSTSESLKTNFDQLINELLIFYNKLNINTMADSNWATVLNFQIPASKNIKLNLNIDELLKNDDVGKRIMEKMNKMKEPSFLELYANAKEKKEKKEKKNEKKKEGGKSKNEQDEKDEKD